MSYFVAVAEGQRRRAVWERVFGVDRLPVLDGHPRQAEFRYGPVWVFDVALGVLHQAQLDRLAGYVARRHGVGYGEALALVRRQGLLIRAEGIVIETADAWGGVDRFKFMDRSFSNATTSASSMFGSRL